ncbi:ABC transporter ATP-binding protein [Promicromonospora thailandica]|uniref:Peptide/nickel transport system ATP-binding protein n=1 Tax=Promicromonospora thailandica TaxID=765201 RepID=A0A9X2G778_9MICO|nr:ABC transporter ATP-binding protein [Promicromonospora thailandica]MCP2267008.1 peptide/nickel transport system ATP-binding protein [Promicromonospora thailandica]BFF16714.1 ABC transporter ATP-binding protein [Promicromonospora thailandica]
MSTQTAHDTRPAARAASGDVLHVTGLTVEYGTDGDPVRACTDVTFTLRRGEILGVAGESGSGKSTLITALTRLQRPPAATTAGSIVFHPRDGGPAVDLVTASPRTLRALRWTSLSIVLQSAMDALNPVMRLGAQFADVLRTHDRTLDRKAAWARAAELLTTVGISGDRVRSYPHELSGGMRQRAGIALALACGPELVVMDEPTTAVDVVMQRQILAQVLRLRRTLGFAVVFVTHDLSLLLELADRIAIMYAGRIVELGTAQELYDAPRHPYTRGLRDSFPPLRAPLWRLTGIPGTPPDLRRPPSGCPFHPRCPQRFAGCDTHLPVLGEAGGAHLVACRLDDGDAAATGTERTTDGGDR